MIKKYLFYLLLIIVIATFFRFWQLDTIPPGLYPDVAINGINAITANETGDYKLFYPDNNGREGLFINLIALSFKIFGPSVWAIKIVAAIIGVLTIFGLYLLANELFGAQIALWSSFFLSISFWHVNFSRIGFRAIMLPFILVFSFYFIYRGLRRQNIYDFIWAGLIYGLGFHTYIAFRLSPLILFIPLLSLFINKWGWKKIITVIFVFSISAFLTAAPLIFYFINHPADFFGRTGQVSVFSSPNPIKELAISTAAALGMFNIYGDANWRHNYAGTPLLLWPVGILFLIGIIISIKNNLDSRFPARSCYSVAGGHGNDSGYLFIIIWLIIMLLPAILTTEGLPHALRAIGAIPPVFIFTGLGAHWLYNKFNNKISNKKVLITFCMAFLIALIISSYQLYFIKWGQNQAVRGAFSQNYVDIGNYLNSLPPETQKYVIVNQGGVEVNGVPMPAQTVKFITESRIKNQESRIKYLLPNQLDKITVNNQPIVIVPISYDKKIFSELQTQFPNGKIEKKENFEIFFLSFPCPPATL